MVLLVVLLFSRSSALAGAFYQALAFRLPGTLLSRLSGRHRPTSASPSPVFRCAPEGIQPSGLLQPKYLQARASELLHIETSAEQAGTMLDKPVIVLTAGQPVDSSLKAAFDPKDCDGYRRTWIDDLQLRLARLSTRGRREIVPDSGLDIIADRPDAIMSAVREMWVL